MGLVGPWLSTTSTKKRAEKITKAKQEEFERGWRDRNQRLKEMHLPKETFEQYMEFVYGRSKKEKTPKESWTPRTNDACRPGTEASTQILSLRDWVTGPCSSKPSP